MQIKDVEAGYKHRIIISVYSYSHIQSLAVGLLEKEIVHGVHRFTMFWSLKRHWLHKIGNQAWGHSLTVSTKRRSVAAATKWPVWAGRQGTLGGGSDLSAGPIKIQSLDKYSAVSERSIALWCTHIINRPVLSRQSCYPPPPHSLSAPFFAGAFSICDGELQASCLALFLRRLVDWIQQPRRPDDYVLGSPPTILCAPH